MKEKICSDFVFPVSYNLFNCLVQLKGEPWSQIKGIFQQPFLSDALTNYIHFESRTSAL